MVEMLARRGIRNRRVLEVMRELPRHLFVEEALRSKAYGDHALPIAGGQTISQPYMVARMTELLEPSSRDRVLEIGAGSGYQTAVLSQLVWQVYAIERIAELARSAQNLLRQLDIYNATIKCFDGTIGWSGFAPYDGILVAAASPDIPEPLVEQLAPNGRLVIPVGSQQSQQLIRLIKAPHGEIIEDHGSCIFVKLIGRYGWES